VVVEDRHALARHLVAAPERGRVRDAREVGVDLLRDLDGRGLDAGRLGDELCVLDLYVAVVSRFNPRRTRFYEVAPRMGEVVRRVDGDLRVVDLWRARMPPLA
jgi:hypothetical protein